MPQLPDQLSRIAVQQIDPSGLNVLQVALISDNASRRQMKEVSDDL